MTEKRPLNPDMLVLARQSRGYGQSELAGLVSMSPGWLSLVESGLREMPPEKLEKVAKVLEFPVSFFTSTARVRGPGISELFHRSRSKIPVRARDKDHAWCEINRLNLEILLKGVDLGDIEIPRYDLHEFDGSVQDVARAVRAKWELPTGPVRNVVEAIEEARGIVVPIRFDSRLIDATSCWPSNLPPVLFMGVDFPTDRMRFSLCHELGHLVMHQDSPNPFQESQADLFAAEFLMPEREITPYLMDLTVPKLVSLKSYWKVSMAAILKRARDTGVVTDSHAKTLWITMGKAGYRAREPIQTDLPPERPKLLQEIVSIYCDQMGYSVDELAHLFHLNQVDVCRMYFGASELGTKDEARAAIEEAQRILDEFKRRRS